MMFFELRQTCRSNSYKRRRISKTLSKCSYPCSYFRQSHLHFYLLSLFPNFNGLLISNSFATFMFVFSTGHFPLPTNFIFLGPKLCIDWKLHQNTVFFSTCNFSTILSAPTKALISCIISSNFYLPTLQFQEQIRLLHSSTTSLDLMLSFSSLARPFYSATPTTSVFFFYGGQSSPTKCFQCSGDVKNCVTFRIFCIALSIIVL